MDHHGKTLKKAIALSDKSVTEIAAIIGVSRQTLYEWYKEEEFTHENIMALKKADIIIVKDERRMSGDELDTIDDVGILKMKLKLAEQEITILKQEKELKDLHSKLKPKGGTFSNKD